MRIAVWRFREERMKSRISLSAGSIHEDREGKYHAFYTGYNRDYPKQGKPSQVLMHAVV